MDIVNQAREMVRQFRRVNAGHVRIAAIKATPEQLDEMADWMLPHFTEAKALGLVAWRKRVRADAASGTLLFCGIPVRPA